MKSISLFTFLLFMFSVSIAQNNVTDSTTISSKKNQLIAGVSYNSALNYYGRTDSLKSKGIYPFIGVNFKNGLYVNSNFVFITNAVSTEYAASIIEAGYQFQSKSTKWSGNIFTNAFLYRKNSGLVQSAVKGTAGLNLVHSNKIININIGSDVKLSSDLDYGAAAGLDHAFRIEKIGKGVIVIDPSAYANAGTQNFTKTYYEKKNLLFIPAGEQQVTTSSKKFSVLSYEFSMPVVYALGKMNIILSPAYILPQNFILVPGSAEASGKADNLFYLTATAKFTF